MWRCRVAVQIVMGGLALAWASFAGAVAAQEPAASGQPLKVAVTEWVGFAERGADGRLYGLNVDLANALCDEMRVRCDVVMMPFGQIMEKLSTGQDIDMAVATILRTPEREARFLFGISYVRSSSSFVARADAFHDVTPEALAGKRIAIALGTKQADFARKHYGAVTVMVEHARFDDLLSLVQTGKADVALAPTISALQLIAREENPNIKIIGQPITSDGLGGEAGIGFPFGKEGLRDRANDALRAVLSDGRYDAISARYFPFRLN